ncbi:MAG: C39 family peptidase [bacterium]
MFKIALKIAIVALVAYGAYFYFIEYYETPDDVPEVSYEEVIAEDEEVSAGSEEVIAEDEEVGAGSEEVIEELGEEIGDETLETFETSFPDEFNLAVPFTSQAPHADWGLPYQEACEEASAFMVSLYYKGEPAGQINADVADAGILEAIEFENDYLGFYLDTTAAETADFIDMFYGLSTTVIDNPTVEQIKAEIAAGRPVIVPAAGRELGNPNFSGAGPLYHMFVIKGYTKDRFITNDPGTRNGESYVYDIDVIMDAMGDWNNGDPANGAKRIILVAP